MALIIEERVLVGAVRMAELFKRRSNAIFSTYSLSFSQYNTLRVLYSAHKGEMTLSEIAERMLVSNPNLSGITKRLEKGGFISRKINTDDERKRTLKITQKGIRVVGLIIKKQEENIVTLLDGFSDTEKKLFFKMIKKVLGVGD